MKFHQYRIDATHLVVSANDGVVTASGEVAPPAGHRHAACVTDADLPVFDRHDDLAWELRQRAGYDLDALDIATDLTGTGLHTDLPRLRRERVGARFWSVFVPRASTQPVRTATLLHVADALVKCRCEFRTAQVSVARRDSGRINHGG